MRTIVDRSCHVIDPDMWLAVRMRSVCRWIPRRWSRLSTIAFALAEQRA